MRKIIYLIFALCYLSANAQTGNMLLNKKFVDLRGKPATTIFVNETPDTLKLNYRFFTWLPYTETRDSIKIAPGQKGTIKLDFNFPDRIEINGKFFVYNAPGQSLVCHITSYINGIDLNFEGAFAQENIYYLAYQRFLKNYAYESRPFYAISDTLKNWNTFPTKADSITRIRLNFLSQYGGTLPAWFKLHEKRRLLYARNQYLLNALVSKEFSSGKKINVNKSYFDFEKSLNKETDMVLNDTYLYCMGDYFSRLTKQYNPALTMAQIINKLYPKSDIGDVNLMRALGMQYNFDKAGYQKDIQTAKFKRLERKVWIDSVAQLKLGNPQINKKAPAIDMTDIWGNKVSLSDYLGKTVIINFWATWCKPCIVQFPDENKLHQKYKDKGLVVINICCDSEPNVWKQMSKEHNLQMVNVYTPRGNFNKLLNRYNLNGLPKSILINKKGLVTDNSFKRASMLTATDINKILVN